MDPSMDCNLTGLAPMVGSSRLVALLGRGSFGQVYEALNGVTGQPEAVKVLAKRDMADAKKVRGLWQELLALQQLRHRNIVTLLDCTHNTRYVCLHMKFAGRRNLWSAIEDAGQRLDFATASLVCTQVALALAHCHGAGIVHKDVKTPNIVLSEDGGARGAAVTAKLVDFGFAASIGTVGELRQCGTVSFMSPELLCGTMRERQATMADMWAHGMVMLDSLCGNGRCFDLLGWPDDVQVEPRLGKELAEFFGRGSEAITAALAAALVPAAHIGQLVTLLAGELQVKVQERWTASAVAEQMEHQHNFS